MIRLLSVSKVLLLALFVFSESISVGQNVVINEFMADNNSTVQDAEGDYSDWVELHNYGSGSIDLEGYALTDDPTSSTIWQFPQVIIPAGGFLLVFASDKDTVIDGEFHMNFKISSSGEPLLLIDPIGEILDHISPIELDDDESYGRISDGSETLTRLHTATPGSSNAASNTVICSHESGWYSDPVNLVFTTSGGSDLRYTINGAVPTSDSPILPQTLLVDDVSDHPNVISEIPLTPLEGPWQLEQFIWHEPDQVYKANVIRYAFFDGANLVGKVHTRILFIDPEFGTRYTFPIVSVVTDSLSLFDHDTGIMVPGTYFEEHGFGWFPAGNYHHDGFDWERPAHVSYYTPTGQLQFERDAGIRIRGFGSAAMPQKSLNVFFRSEYGSSAVEYPIYNDPNGPTKFKRLILRNSGNDFRKTHFRDAILQKIISPMHLDIQRAEPSILFINGEYWGIMNLRDKIDEYYFDYYAGIDPEDLTMVHPCGSLEHGNAWEYGILEDYVENNDFSIPTNYDSLSSILDIENLIDYQIAEIFYANYDWPQNNHKVWKASGVNSKWRHLVIDLDLSTAFIDRSLYDHPSLVHATTTSNEWPWRPCASLIFRKLLENENFVNAFIARFEYHLNHTFKASNVLAHIDSMESIYRAEMPEHINRWGHPESMDEWDEYLTEFKDFMKLRPCYMKQHITEFFQLDTLFVDCEYIESQPGDFHMYPNPNKGQSLFVDLRSYGKDRWDIELYDVSGKLVLEHFVSGLSTIDTGTLPSGLYIFIARSEGETIRDKLIISR